MADYIVPIRKLIDAYRRLPGVGEKTATRYAFATLNLSPEEAELFADAVIGVKRDIAMCPVCCGLSAGGECDICADSDRDPSVICVVENPKDVTVMEKVRGYRGKYHVLGGALAPLDGITPDKLHIKELIDRVSAGGVTEVIIAANATPQGDTTAAYLARVLEPYGVKTSRLAYGIPVGGDIEYADDVTLYRAFEGRRSL
ncbi:MAG: recombination mediator RecR [Clostridia bacterium]|nr:recombination mediator RecR [Clostridia bacterium]